MQKLLLLANLSTLLCTMIVQFPPESFLELGLNLKGFSSDAINRTGDATNIDRFQAFCCCTPQVASEIFEDLQSTDEMFMVSVDGVHCRMHEPRILPSSGWCSKKFNKAGFVGEHA